MQQQEDILSDFNREQVSLQEVTKGTRFANALIDGIVLNVLNRIATAVFTLPIASLTNLLPTFLVGAIISVSYYTVMEGLTGKTLGKMVTRTKVIRTDLDRPLNYNDAFLRSLVRLIPLLDAISIFWGEIWHDQFTRTRVVKEVR